MTRSEHIVWAKGRALEYLDDPGGPDLMSAYQSLLSDLSKHEETRGHPAIELGNRQLFAGLLDTEARVRDFIEGIG